jgi:hypothetical protein
MPFSFRLLADRQEAPDLGLGGAQLAAGGLDEGHALEDGDLVVVSGA